MDVYAELARYQDIRINGVPADLIAMRARRETSRLREGLLAGRWEIDRATFTIYAEQLGLKPDPTRVALSSAVEWVASQRQPSGRIAKDLEGVPIAILWNTSLGRLSALIAGPGYQSRQWLQGLDRSRISLNGGRTPDSVVRTAAATGLPWSIAVKPGDVPNQAARRTFLTVGLGILSFAVAITATLLAIVLSRELAVARLKSDFVAAVSHEFRTPLTTLRQYNEMLLEQEDLSLGERGVYLQAQQRAVDRLHRMVESLLDFRRMEARAWKYRMQAVDAGTLVSEVVGEFRAETAGHGFTISCRTDVPPVSIYGDPEALGRALWNLLDNARKYSGQARNIEVEVVRENRHVNVSVRDHGCGIEKADRKRIFEKFVRGRQIGRSGIQGTGIGLAMVRHIAGAHGGHVELTSQPERGSTFTIVLPVKEVPCSES